ncbi:unnamed protein product [Closterium sp. NIES-54]
MVTTTTPGGQRVSICTCTRTGRHLATFTRRPGSSLYTQATEPPPVAASAQHHCLGHPSLPRLCGMHSRLLVSDLPRSLPPLPPSSAPTCLPCVKGRQRAAPHSSFPSTTAPLLTLHMDVWGQARVSGQGRERYFLLVVDDYTRYTTVFPLRSNGQVVDVLIPWIRAFRLQFRERFRQDVPVLRLHFDRGGEFSSDLLRDFCRGEGILHHGGRSYLHDPCGCSPFSVAVCGKVGDASVFRVWGSRAFVRDTSAEKLSVRAIPYVFLGFTLDAAGWQFYHPTSRRVFPSQEVTFDESVPFYCLFPYRFAPPPPPPLFLAPGSPPGAGSGGAEPGGEEPGGAEPAGVEPGGAEPEGVEPGGAESEGAESGGAEPQSAASSGGPSGAWPRLSPQQLREWLIRCARLRSGATGARGAGAAVAGAATGPGGARTRGTGAAGTGGVGGAGSGDPTEPGATGAGGFVSQDRIPLENVALKVTEVEVACVETHMITNRNGMITSMAIGQAFM